MVDKQLLKEVLDTAAANGCDFSDIFIENRQTTGIRCSRQAKKVPLSWLCLLFIFLAFTISCISIIQYQSKYSFIFEIVLPA